MNEYRVAEPIAQRLRGRFALLSKRDGVITPERIREIMERGN